MLCSVIILNWNGADCLKKFLPSVVQHTTDEQVEIVVADNGSTDDSIAVLQQFPSVRTLLLDKNYGFAEGYNRAIKMVDSQYIVLLNSDVEVTPNWLQPMLTYLGQHPDVVAVQPKILSYRTQQQQPPSFEHAGAAGGYIDSLGYPFCRGRILNRIEQDHGQYDTIAPIFWASGACLTCRREDYLEAGGLDAKFFAHMEEIDLCWRWQARGKQIVCIPQSVVWHVGGASLHYDNPRKTYLNFRNNLLMLYKNLPPHTLYKVLFCRFFLDHIAALNYLLHLDWKNYRAVWQARRDYHRMKRGYKAVRQNNLNATIEKRPATLISGTILIPNTLHLP